MFECHIQMTLYVGFVASENIGWYVTGISRTATLYV